MRRAAGLLVGLAVVFVGCGARTALDDAADAGPPVQVDCLGVTCAAGEVCCATGCTFEPVHRVLAECVPRDACPADFSQPARLGSTCDGPEDCGGQSCCARPMTDVSEGGVCERWVATCEARCPTDETGVRGAPVAVVCRTTADCPSGQRCCDCESYLYPMCQTECGWAPDFTPMCTSR